MTTKFDDIAPFREEEVKPALKEVLADPKFEHAIRYIMPDVDWGEFSDSMLGYDTRSEFQKGIVSITLWMLAGKTTDGLRAECWENVDSTCEHLFLSNHRDIVLDAGFLNILRSKHNIETTEIAIGDNLLIHPWIEKLVRVNKSFLVKRDLGIREQLTASKHMSEYIHYAINEKKESVWMAQREGRAKDSDDRTQISLLKMLALAPEKTPFIDCLLNLNISPLSISYEYDPCDYLKAKEFQLKRNDPEFKKSQRDDLLNMEIGLLGYKGKVVFRFGKCVNDRLAQITESDKRIQVEIAAKIIDAEIHRNYEIYSINYIAYDLLHKTQRFADKYTEQQIADFKSYLDKQIEKIEIENKDYEYLFSTMLLMYSNMLKNKLEACEEIT